MKTDKLYNNILSLIYNVLKNTKLRKEMRLNKNLREYIITQVNNLLGIEKDYKLEKDSNLSIMIAQIVVNQLGTEEQIEKPDSSILENFRDDYNNLIKFIDSNFPDLMFSTNFNENEIVNEELIKSLPDFIKKQDLELNKILINSKDEIKNVKPIDLNNNTKSEQNNNNFKESNSQSRQTRSNFNPNNAAQFGLPQNPLTNPNFYPYKTKPKIMHNLKFISFIFYALITFMVIFLYFYSKRYLGIKIFSNNVDITSNSQYVVKSGLSTYNNEVFLPYALFGSILVPMLFFMTTIFLGFSVFGQKNAKREKFHLSYTIIGSSTILLFIIIYYVSLYSIPSLFTNKILDSFKNSNIKWDIVADPNYANELTNSVNVLSTTFQYKIANYLSIAVLFFTIIEIIIFILTMIYNPKVDQQKIRRAQFEYQKLIEARFNGQDYEIDPTLFDEDEDDQSNQKK